MSYPPSQYPGYAPYSGYAPQAYSPQGYPAYSPPTAKEQKKNYKTEKKQGADLDGDGYIGNPTAGQRVGALNMKKGDLKKLKKLEEKYNFDFNRDGYIGTSKAAVVPYTGQSAPIVPSYAVPTPTYSPSYYPTAAPAATVTQAYPTQAYPTQVYATQAYTQPSYATQTYAQPAYQAYAQPAYATQTYAQPAYAQQTYPTSYAPAQYGSYASPFAQTTYAPSIAQAEANLGFDLNGDGFIGANPYAAAVQPYNNFASYPSYGGHAPTTYGSSVVSSGYGGYSGYAGAYPGTVGTAYPSSGYAGYVPTQGYGY
eukprot:NODE_989_length_1186_cov_375.208443_g750_i0.p1 GENE.NODE_989_length_1186_cov_375.208443_g750_i0~~NODE_989_length_1186_cov_375.208443_g750_i0.p1  ORF type:complete len:329 (-),score=68.69 NODE_989_length_1186_cov_375.208443_g750_i0:199-1131(-)